MHIRSSLARRTVLLGALLVSSGLVCSWIFSPGPASAASTPAYRWMFENWSLSHLSWLARQHARIPPSMVMSEITPLTTGWHDGLYLNAEHYERITTCAGYTGHYRTPCLSLTDNPPPAGTYAILDLESWTLTPSYEYTHQCATTRQAISIIRAHGAIPVIYLSWTGYLLRCAARALLGGPGVIHLGGQSSEASLPTFTASLTAMKATVVAVNPAVQFSFGVSTRLKYNATAWRMHRAWQAGLKILGPNAWCWVNVIPDKPGSYQMADRMFLYIYG